MQKIKMKDFIKCVDMCDYAIVTYGERRGDDSNVVYNGNIYNVTPDVVEKYFNRSIDMIYSSMDGIVFELSED